MERDHSTRIDGFLPRDFNSHAHVERDGLKINNGNGTFNFNSHAHVERDTAQITDMQLGVNFNSHAHVERDDSLTENLPALVISTHTLTWSVTHVAIATGEGNKFQLTRSRGA